jgi:signal transduction histidine kinase
VRRLELLLWAAAFGFGLVAEWLGPGFADAATWTPDLITGWTLLLTGLAARARRPESRFGLLLAATSAAWFAGTLWPALATLHRAPLAQAVFAFPSGRLASTLDRAAVGLLYATWPLAPSEALTIAFALLLVAIPVADRRKAVGVDRRGRLPAVWAAIALSIVVAAGAGARIAFPEGDADDPALLTYEVVLCAVAVGLTATLVSGRWLRPPVADLVVELGETRTATIRDALADALGDPSLEVAYRADGGWVNAWGQPVVLPPEGAGRAVTPIERDGRAVAVLVHDPGVLADPGVADAVSRAAALAAANAQLQRDIRAQAAELEASRRRLLVAGDAERERLEHRLRRGAERRLARLAAKLAHARTSASGDALESVDHAERRLASTIADLEELGRGLHPRLLSELGLEGALAELARRSPLPVAVSVATGRLSGELEAAVYFVCSETLANAAKHAGATGVAIRAVAGGGELTVEVADDGRGGADAAKGSGLRGLADRVEALGGELGIESPPGGGTLVTARLPLGRDYA